MIDPHTRLALQTAIVKYDRRQKRNKGYNPYTLEHCCRALQNVDEDMENGSTLAQALYDNAIGRLLTALEKAANLPVTYGGGGKSTGRPTY